MELSNLDKYKFMVHVYQTLKCDDGHMHHIKPRCIYPELGDDKDNVVKVPRTVHWWLHRRLYDHYVETGNQRCTKMMSSPAGNLETYINGEFDINKIDWEKRERIERFIEFIVFSSFISYQDEIEQWNENLTMGRNGVVIVGSANCGEKKRIRLIVGDKARESIRNRFHDSFEETMCYFYINMEFNRDNVLKIIEHCMANGMPIFTSHKTGFLVDEFNLQYHPQKAWDYVPDKPKIIWQIDEEVQREFGLKLLDELDMVNDDMDAIGDKWRKGSITMALEFV